ncbi:MAG: D-aminoacyl-tRNA deacylase [Erysipelotrichaceae bacterium]|nr:D-aminoacyl-tRNA deacylase [Erysipelotrichaceae bacterium]
MRILVQRVKNASVTIDGQLFSQIKQGYLLLVGFSNNDDENIVELMTQKLLNLRICDDSDGKMNLSIIDTKGEILSVSQFTLYADSSKGRRPSFIDACNPERAVQLYDYFNDKLRKSGLKVETGKFRAEMDVQLVNSGPITIMLDSDIIIKR